MDNILIYTVSERLLLRKFSCSTFHYNIIICFAYCFQYTVRRGILFSVICLQFINNDVIVKLINYRMYSLTAVDNLEAKVISRFPFNPSRAGTKIKISDTSL